MLGKPIVMFKELDIYLACGLGASGSWFMMVQVYYLQSSGTGACDREKSFHNMAGK